MKSTVEQLSPTRVRINVEVPFDELKPDFDRAYRKIAQQVRIPGFRPGKAPAAHPGGAPGPRRGARRGRQRRHPGQVLRGRHDVRRRRPRSGSPTSRSPRSRTATHLAFTAEVDVRPDDHAARSRRRHRHRRRRRGRPRTRRPSSSTTCAPASAPSPASSARPPTATSCSSTCRPPSTARRSRGRDHRLLLPGRPGQPDRRPRRGACVGLSAGESNDLHLDARRRRVRRPRRRVTATVGRSRSASCRPRTTSSPSSPASSTPSTSSRPTCGAASGRSEAHGAAQQARDKVLEAIARRRRRSRCRRASSQAEVESRLHDAVHGLDHDDARFAEFLDEQGKTPRGVRHRHPTRPPSKSVKTQLRARRDRRRRGDLRRRPGAHRADRLPGAAVPACRRSSSSSGSSRPASSARSSPTCAAARRWPSVVGAATVTDAVGHARRPDRAARQADEDAEAEIDGAGPTTQWTRPAGTAGRRRPPTNGQGRDTAEARRGRADGCSAGADDAARVRQGRRRGDSDRARSRSRERTEPCADGERVGARRVGTPVPSTSLVLVVTSQQRQSEQAGD